MKLTLKHAIAAIIVVLSLAAPHAEDAGTPSRAPDVLEELRRGEHFERGALTTIGVDVLDEALGIKQNTLG